MNRCKCYGKQQTDSGRKSWLPSFLFLFWGKLATTRETAGSSQDTAERDGRAAGFSLRTPIFSSLLSLSVSRSRTTKKGRIFPSLPLFLRGSPRARITHTTEQRQKWRRGMNSSLSVACIYPKNTNTQTGPRFLSTQTFP